MNITIIGASAGIGLETVKRGLNRNHSITTLSRSEIGIEGKESLNMILGDATNKTDLINSIQNADAIIVTLGTGKKMNKQREQNRDPIYFCYRIWSWRK